MTLAMTLKKDDRKLLPQEIRHLRELQAALIDTKPPDSRWALYLLASLLASFLVWAALSPVDEVTRGQARVIASSGEQTIQSLEGGLLERLHVREGDRVDAGQILVEVDPTKANAAYQEGISKLMALKAGVARLRAEAYDQPLKFPPELKPGSELVRNETQAYQARRRVLEQSVSELEHSLELVKKELALSEPLMKRGLLSDIEFLRVKRQLNELQLQISERRNKYRSDANAELLRMESDLAQTQENTVAKKDTAQRTVIKSPVHGIVKNISITTRGGVIAPGAVIMEIVPLDDQLQVEVKIKPQDVAFLREHMPALVKITAYDFSIYGGLEGEVVHISPDTLKEQSRTALATGGEETFYRVLVQTRDSALRKGDKVLPIIPGMTASVDIRAGQKTVLDYLLKPVFKAREALQEK